MAKKKRTISLDDFSIIFVGIQKVEETVSK